MIMKIPSLDLLSTLVAVAESPNLIEASRRLGMSQPAVTQHLQKLEQSSPYPLFTYQGKRKVLTRFGETLYESARSDLLRLEQGIARVTQAYALPENLTLRLGCRREIFSVAARKFHFPGRVEFSALSSQQALERLFDRSIDIAVSARRPDAHEIVARKIFNYDTRIVVHKKWLQGSDTFTLHQASSPEFLTRVPALAYRRDAPLLREWLTAQGISPNSITPRILCEDWRILMQLVEAHAGYALIPAHTPSFSPEVVSLPVPTSVIPEVTFYALFHRELRKIPAFKELLAQIEGEP